MLYEAYEAGRDLARPMRRAAALNAVAFGPSPSGGAEPRWLRESRAALEALSRSGLSHRRPEFGIGEVTFNGEPVPVRENAVCATPFATLVHFAKETDVPQPRVLVVAPLSGHFATLVRGTVWTLLSGHDVFVTDWHNARDVALRHGGFGLDEYVEHLIAFLTAIGTGAHVIAVCQPCVPALAAAAVMAEDDDPARPRSLTLMAGPIDARINPTQVNRLACGRPLEWFERNVIMPVPLRHPGRLRPVYPGFLQLAAFMSMNRDRHLTALRGLYRDIAEGNAERAAKTQAFYDEYFSVLDLPAEFYLETVRSIFQEHDLARGRLRWRDRPVDPRALRCALLTIEGEYDDISAVGQTAAAHDLCPQIPSAWRLHHLQAGVGHYGVFSGRRWEREVYPVVEAFITAAD